MVTANPTRVALHSAGNSFQGLCMTAATSDVTAGWILVGAGVAVIVALETIRYYRDRSRSLEAQLVYGGK
jgi:hypothetical protein